MDLYTFCFKYFVLYENKHHSKDPGVDGKIMLRWFFKRLDVGVWTGSSWLRIGTGGGQL